MLRTFRNFGTEKIINKLLTYSLLITLPLTFNSTVLAQPVSTPTPNGTESVNSADGEIIKKLSGQWQSQDSASPIGVSFIFTTDGKLFLMMGDDKRSAAYPLTYRINSTPQPMHLDIKLPDAPKPVLTIFNFTADGQMQMQIEGTNPGEPRPKDFSQNVTLFKKVSESTTLPANVELITNENKPAQQREQENVSEGKLYIGTINRGQQAYYLENNKFARTIQDLKIGIKSETENYRYRIISTGNKSQIVVHTATAKKPDLKSYTGVVFVTKIKGDTVQKAGICETLKPSSKPPTTPRIPTRSSEDIKCPSGSILLK